MGIGFSYQRDFGFIAPALKCVGFYGTYTYTHDVEDFNFEGRENESGLSLPGSPNTLPMLLSIFEKEGWMCLSYNHASALSMKWDRAHLWQILWCCELYGCKCQLYFWQKRWKWRSMPKQTIYWTSPSLLSGERKTGQCRPNIMEWNKMRVLK